MVELYRDENHIYTLEEDLFPYDKQRLFQLWNHEYPMQLKYQDMEKFDTYLNGLNHKESILVRTFGNQIIGWFFKFERENEYWFVTIIDSKFKRQGIGSTLLQLGKKEFGSLKGWVIDHERYFKNNGEKYQSPMAFYIKNGCRINHDTRLETALLSAVKISI